MRSRAAALKPWAWTVRALLSSPRARILTGTSLRLARPRSRSPGGVTSAPASKRASRSARLTGWVCVRKGSNGMDFFMCGPRSLRIRMWMGFWPPSKRARRLAPERDPHPFWPRPAVFPVPEPSPRPTRLRAFLDPGAGLRLCRPIRPFASGIVLHLHKVPDLVDHAADLRRVLVLHTVADPPQAERPQGVDLALVRAVPRPALGDD